MKKALKKAVMPGSNLKNKRNKNRSTEHWNDYKKQRNFYGILLQNTKNTILAILI